MPLEVIGAGLGRTGTTSLTLALERLGFVRCHHMTEVIRHPETAKDWERAAEGQPVDWEAILAGYRATTDWPACHFYALFAARYPRAKVILTVRDPESWFRSTQATIFSEEHLKEVERRPMAGILTKIIAPVFDGRWHDRDHMIAVYERPRQGVVTYRAVARASRRPTGAAGQDRKRESQRERVREPRLC